MSDLTPAEKVRAALKQVPASAMMADPSEARQTPAYGGRWFSPGKEAYLYLGYADILLLQDAPPHSPQWKPWIHEGSIRLGGVFISFCIWRWIEEVAHPSSFLASIGLVQPTALRLNLAVEQINYPTIELPAVTGLNDDDMEQIARFIRVAMQQYLKKSVAYDRGIEEKYGRSLTVIGKLHENWRSPRPLLAELHDHIHRYAASFSMERIYDPALESYHLEDADIPKRVYIVGKPEVSIRLPREDREYPAYDPGIVRMGSMEILIDVQHLSTRRLAEITPDPLGNRIEEVRFYRMTHPFSLRVTPEHRIRAGLTMDIANQAVEHMRNAWLTYCNRRLQGTTRTDVVII